MKPPRLPALLVLLGLAWLLASPARAEQIISFSRRESAVIEAVFLGIICAVLLIPVVGAVLLLGGVMGGLRRLERWISGEVPREGVEADPPDPPKGEKTPPPQAGDALSREERGSLGKGTFARDALRLAFLEAVLWVTCFPLAIFLEASWTDLLPYVALLGRLFGVLAIARLEVHRFYPGTGGMGRWVILGGFVLTAGLLAMLVLDVMLQDWAARWAWMGSLVLFVHWVTMTSSVELRKRERPGRHLADVFGASFVNAVPFMPGRERVFRITALGAAVAVVLLTAVGWIPPRTLFRLDALVLLPVVFSAASLFHLLTVAWMVAYFRDVQDRDAMI